MLATVLRLFILFELTVYSALAWYFLDATVLSAALYAVAAVSYTHLTLPTSDLV